MKLGIRGRFKEKAGAERSGSMKKIIALVLVMMLGFCTVALAEAPSIDLSSMSLEQLTALRAQVDAAIQNLQASASPTDQLESATRKAPGRSSWR